MYKFKFECVPGFFIQDDPETDYQGFDYLSCNFGLDPELTWPEFAKAITKLQSQQDRSTRYKVLYLARHGQGYHNLAIEVYGQEKWDNELAKLNGNNEIIWGPDAELTALGISQAQANCKEWKNQLRNGIPKPQKFYASPFTRALDTMMYTWDDIILWKNKSGSTESESKSALVDNLTLPLVMEDLRETMHVHTCDKRRARSYIEERFPLVDVQSSFVEQDELWKPEGRETEVEHEMRTSRFLQFLFNKDWNATHPDTYISVTTHSGTNDSFLSVIGHQVFKTATGGMIPVVVKAIRI
jgi:hypothetical protein